MKGFLKIFVAITGLLLLLIPLFLSSHLYGFPQNANSYSEAIEKDLEYLQNLNERTDNLIFIGEMDSIRFLVNEALLLSEIFNDLEEEAQAYINLGAFF